MFILFIGYTRQITSQDIYIPCHRIFVVCIFHIPTYNEELFRAISFKDNRKILMLINIQYIYSTYDFYMVQAIENAFNPIRKL